MSYPEQEAKLIEAITWLTQIMQGDASTNIDVDGTVKPSISKDIADRYGDVALSEGFGDPQLEKLLTLFSSYNLYDKEFAADGEYVSNDGSINQLSGWARSAYIAVKAGETYTLSSNTERRSGISFFTDKDPEAYISGTYVASTAITVTFTVPATAEYVVFNTKSTSLPEPTEIQLELGSAATAYQDYQIAFIESEEEVQLKNYEIIVPSKNLYDASEKQDGNYLNNSGEILSAAGWSCTGYIPVTSGENYTISFSGTRRQGLAFFASDSDTASISNTYSSTQTNPLTVSVPTGASFIVINLDSTSAPEPIDFQIEAGSSQTAYEEYSTEIKIDGSKIFTELEPVEPVDPAEPESAKNTLAINGDSASLSAFVDDVPISIGLALRKENTHGNSIVFNFSGDVVDGVLQRSLNDDVAPIRADNATIGANHGYRKTIITASSHGKTNADIGSVWSDGSKEWVIVEILSNDSLSITARIDNSSFSGSALTHVSGASSTGNITSTAESAGQWYQCFKNHSLKCSVDSDFIDLSEDTEHDFAESASFIESYDIMSKSDMVEWLIANNGQDYDFYDADTSLTVNNSYVFDKELGCSIVYSLTAFKAIDFNDVMVTQSIRLADGNGTVYYYIPKSLPFTAGGYSYDFENKEDIVAKSPSSPLLFTPSVSDSSLNPIDRLVQLNDDVGYATGYLPIFDAEPVIRATNASDKYLEIRNGSLKVYPSLIDGLANTLAQGDYFSAVAYRKYFVRSSEYTANYVIRSHYADYLYLDWHSTGLVNIDLKSDLIGRPFTIHESKNATLLSDIASGQITVNVTASPAHLVLRFDK